MIPAYLAAATLAIGLVAGFAYGLRVGARRAADARVDDVEAAFERGKRVGADDIVDQMIAAEMRAPDAIERNWPTPRTTEGRPS